ncbi:hypothetical protein ACFQX4_28145 [Roseomonas sp. GCM10028921]
MIDVPKAILVAGLMTAVAVYLAGAQDRYAALPYQSGILLLDKSSGAFSPCTVKASAERQPLMVECGSVPRRP